MSNVQKGGDWLGADSPLVVDWRLEAGSQFTA